MSGRFESAADFFAAAALAVKDVPLPGGRSVSIRELSVLQRKELARITSEDRDKAEAWIVAQACVSPDGSRFFTDEQVADLMASSPRVVILIADEIAKFSYGETPAGNA